MKKPWCVGQDQCVPLISWSLSNFYQIHLPSLQHCTSRRDSSRRDKYTTSPFSPFSGTYQNTWKLTWCYWAGQIISSPKPVADNPLPERQPALERETGRSPRQKQKQQLSPILLQLGSKVLKKYRPVSQPCWGGDRHWEWEHTRAQHNSPVIPRTSEGISWKMRSPPLLITASLRGSFWEASGILEETVLTLWSWISLCTLREEREDKDPVL